MTKAITTKTTMRIMSKIHTYTQRTLLHMINIEFFLKKNDYQKTSVVKKIQWFTPN